MMPPDEVGEQANSALVVSQHHPERNSQESIISNNPHTYRLSKRRWAILFAISLFGLSNALTGDFASILHTMLDLLELPLHKYVYIRQVLSYVAAVSTFPTARFIDRYGIQMTMYIATILMFFQNTATALLFNPTLPNWKQFKLIYWIISTFAGYQLLTIFFCLPLKISENWFSSSERSIAWTVMMSSISIGASIAAYSFPRLIHQVKDVKPLFYLNIGAGIVTAFAILSCVTRSKPRHPPNDRTASILVPVKYLSSIKLIFKQRDLMLHLLHEAIFEGFFVSILAVTQDILTSVGHDEIFVGNLMSINALVSVVMIISLGALVHRIKNATLSCKIASITRALLYIAYISTMLYPLAGWIVISTSLIFNTCKSWALPNFNNMTAQLVSGIVPEATIAGFAITLTVVTITTSQVAFIQLISVTKEGKSDYTYSISFAAIVCLVNSIVYLLLFKGQTSKRIREENSTVEPSSV